MKKLMSICIIAAIAMMGFTSCKEEIDDIEKDKAPAHVEAIDLGLSVKWANCNLSAISPEDIGGYYAWGEVEEKKEYSPLNYKFYLGDLNEDGNYYEAEEYKNIGTDISGTAYDAARAQWGGTWRMPTTKELKELCEECSWSATEVNGVKGKLVTGPNGNSIFLPCTEIVNDVAAVGIYSSASLGLSQPYAYTILFVYNDIVSGDRTFNGERARGMAIRPVFE
jgi:hypothetical protein